MKKNTLILAGIIALFLSCNKEKKEVFSKKSSEVKKEVVNQNDKGFTLLKNNCYVCHNPKATSHESIIAPPFMAVKMHYTRAYDNKKDFVNALVNWVQNPTKDKALMHGAVNRFKIMPKLPLPKADLEELASYLYDNDVEKPTWMDAHMKEMKANGMMDKH